MLRATLILMVLASGAAWAQNPKGIPTVTITDEDRPVIKESIEKLHKTLLAPPGNLAPDPSTAARLRDVDHNAAFQDEIDPRNVPLLGMALSRNSNDPKACALMKRIEPIARGPLPNGDCPK